MPSQKTEFAPVCLSLADICGADYAEAVCRARGLLTGEDVSALMALAMEEVDFFPESYQERCLSLLDSVGEQIAPPLEDSARGASTKAFNSATKTAMAPLSALGCFRLGEDGRLYLAAKSEHYHVSLGHGFPGYQLIDRARCLGIPNATHNNTRGHITRALEERLVAAANGLDVEDCAGLESVMAENRLDVMNRVLNLETGSLAVEAALKMILARFYKMQRELAAPACEGKSPVILVIGDDEGGLGGNYHGTTIITQMMRGMWPELTARLDVAGAIQIRTIRPNNLADLDAAFAEYEGGFTKIAGLFHEIVMMNYGGLTLTREFLHHAYALCAKHDVPVVCDEIQSCIWSSEIFLFREYGLKPSFVSAGKGFPGGEYPASRIVFSAAMDVNLPQFGALVTNGQEELASLAYLVTLTWAQANAGVTKAVGDYYAGRLREIAARYDGLITAVEGHRHMSTLFIEDLASAKAIAALLVEAGLDISAQTYKADCPPALLTKLPLTAGYEVVDCVIRKIAVALETYTESSGMLRDRAGVR